MASLKKSNNRDSKTRPLDYYINKEDKDNEIIVVDIETTGLKPVLETIVEIGIVKLNLKTGEITELFDEIVREPGLKSIDAKKWVFQNSDLKFDDVKNAPLLSKFVDRLNRIFETYPATAYNKQFDFGFLRRAGVKIPNELPCPMKKSTNVLKLPSKRPEFLYKFPSVEEAWKFYFPNKEYKELHRAYDDAAHEAQIVYEMYKRGLWKKVIKKPNHH